jgi:hypothetical protein
METKDHIAHLEDILTELQSDTLESMTDGNSLMNYGAKISAHNAYAGDMMSRFKRELNQTKAKAQGLDYFTPTMIKDYVGSKCSEQQYNFDLAQRVNRSCVHTMDLIRTSISYLKTELQNLNYQR